MKNLFFCALIMCLINVSTFSQVSNSVLSIGEWYKLRVQESGVYKITYSELQNLGIDVGNIDPAEIKIFGNENGMLSEMNADYRPEDLNELAIWIEGEGDSSFDPGDYILFYCQSAIKWEWDTTDNMFVHEKNIYDDYSYYFLTVSSGQGKRIPDISSLASGNNVTCTEFDDYYFCEDDIYNLINSGKQWVGDLYNFTTPRLYSFNSPNTVINSSVKLKSRLIARSNISSDFTIDCDGQNSFNISFQGINLSSYTGDYAEERIDLNTFSAGDDNIDIQISYSYPNTNSSGWLDYICLNTRRYLTFTTAQMAFRDMGTVGTGNISRFDIGNITANEQIWDVTDIYNIKNQQFNISGSDGWFITETDSLKEYIAFTNAGFLSVDSLYQIPNQNLHALSSAELLIISHPGFVTEAQQLENHHETWDNLTTHTINVIDIYNEFSSGRQDITAIRDFIKFIYEKGAGELKYVLFFGDASYDYKDRLTNNANYVPTWQSENSLRFTSSICSDDFFGLLDSLEGGKTGYLDIGLGRLPVSSENEAHIVVSKIIDYATNSNYFGNWRTDLFSIGDDADGNQHMIQAEHHSELIDTTYCCFNHYKVYLDNYLITSNSTNYYCNDGEDAFETKFNEGKLIVNYTGHGNETNLAHENILDVDSLDFLNNKYRLPLFIAATANANRYDDPQNKSLGRQLFLEEFDGSIASFSAARLTYSTPNYVLNHYIYEQNLFESDIQGNYPKLGDVVRKAKVASGSGMNKRSYILLGDPALTLAIPKEKVIIDQINGVNAISFNDTIYVGENVNITGHIENQMGTIQSNFNGMAYYRLYDTAINDTTLGNNGSTPYVFKSQENVLYSDSCDVYNGQFTCSFSMPSGAQMTFSDGKLSFYATDLQTDAMGCYKGLSMSQLAGLEEVDYFTNTLIYPTITSGYIYVKSSESLDNCRVMVHGIDGRQHIDEVIDQPTTGGELKIDVHTLDQGMYIFTIGHEQFKKSCKIIKQ